MISITGLLSPECISLELHEKRKKRVIAELTDLLQSAGKVENGKALARKILEREAMASTGIGHGIAIPHCLTNLVDDTVMAFGRSTNGIPFDSADNKPAQLIFLLTGPQTATSEHLKLLSKLSRLLTEQQFRTQLFDASTAEEVIELFRREEEV
ncbi:MAG: PTS sugar transporter subunit IIA [Spirochaetia bacterium]|nr:PTS sugar transporter subunit IIA [Spirochaetia bacterium]